MSEATDWLAAARVAADRPPAGPRERLCVEVETGAVEVGSVEPGTAQRMADAGLAIRRDGGAWCIAAPADVSLAAIAAWLRDAGLAGHWRDELLSVVDADERAVAEVERAVVRVLGLTTFAVHLVGESSDSRGTWIQQRAFDKATDPGLWDTLMGGQIAAGETVETALARETWEEAGLDVASLLDLRRRGRLTFRRPVEEGYLVEHIEVYAARLPAGVQPENRDGEVAGFACVDGAELARRLARGDFTLEATLILAR